MPLSDFGIAERTQGRSLLYSRGPIIAEGRAFLTAALSATKEFNGKTSVRPTLRMRGKDGPYQPRAMV